MKPTFRPRIHRTTSVRIYGEPGEAVSLDDYLDSERAAISADGLRSLAEFRPAFEQKLGSDLASQHHDLQEGVKRLLDVLDSPTVLEAADPLPDALAEAGVALAYFLKGVDLIPDSVPEIGLTDDARLVARVLERHPELARLR